MEQVTFIKFSEAKHKTQWLTLNIVDDWCNGYVEKSHIGLMLAVAKAYRQFNLPVVFELNNTGLSWRIDGTKCDIKVEILGRKLSPDQIRRISDQTLAELVALYMENGVNGWQGHVADEEIIDSKYEKAWKEIITMITSSEEAWKEKLLLS